ncbi:hypothetical protein AB205_0058150 [Aquarana catesbeiana]|uniref:Uncharacterized protein n=1 Tax=Aquarana catesbeiana TaxID=8400 RepID=A0A2G9QD71_AQUCT|nr:hypothetical protein AB205_0151700 [Aquarana catesbeiana]PIO13654.1 hypothetical protein AB205_0162150 [Aquarana catesbeiana]PIO13862.1 hypothetical protein AB205_0058150 [Aquarana catesbeiana]
MSYNKSESSAVTVNPILTRKGLYNAVIVKNTQSTECRIQHQGKWVTSQKNSLADADHGIQATGIETTDADDENCLEQPAEATDTYINALSLTVLGMRVLFIKILVFNFLLSVTVICL